MNPFINDESASDSEETKHDPDEKSNDFASLSFCSKLKILFSNKAFLIICFALTFLYYVITGIQYWVSNYLITELK